MCLAVPMKVVELLPNERARVEAGQVNLEVSLRLVAHAAPGDHVLVHTGFALAFLDMDAAEETLKQMHRLTVADPETTEEREDE